VRMAAVFCEARCRPNLDNHHWSTYSLHKARVRHVTRRKPRVQRALARDARGEVAHCGRILRIPLGEHRQASASV
jgi:hypothetical protein